MESFPAFFPLAGRTVVIAGVGPAADAKARLFEGSPASVRRLTAEAARDAAAFAGAALAFVATSDPVLAGEAAAAARAAGTPVNVVDHPELCDFTTPAIVDRGAVVAAVGTGGAAPVLASLLRAELEARISPALGPLAALLARERAAIRAAFPDLAERRAFFRSFLSGPAVGAVAGGDMTEAQGLLAEALSSGARRAGRIVVIVAPEPADRLSVRAVQALASADLILGGPDVEPLISRHGRRDAERGPADAHARAADAAAAGDSVIVVVPERDGRPLDVLARAGVAFDVVIPAP